MKTSFPFAIAVSVTPVPTIKIGRTSNHAFRSLGCAIIGIAVTRLRQHVSADPGPAGRGRMEASFLARATPQVRADRSDIVIAITPSMAELGAGAYAKRGRPLGVLVQDLTGSAAGESGSTGGTAARTIAAAEYGWLRDANRVGVITPQFGTVLVVHGIRPEAVLDLPNFTHITPVSATVAEARERWGWPDHFTVLHTDKMGRKQGLENVVEAARYSEANGSGIHFVLVGDGNQRDALAAAGADISTLSFISPLDSDEYPTPWLRPTPCHSPRSPG